MSDLTSRQNRKRSNKNKAKLHIEEYMRHAIVIEKVSGKKKKEKVSLMDIEAWTYFFGTMNSQSIFFVHYWMKILE